MLFNSIIAIIGRKYFRLRELSFHKLKACFYPYNKMLMLFFKTKKKSVFLLFSFSFILQVLATGLSGLYSSLPTKLEDNGEEWHCLLKDDCLLSPALVQFMNSFEFCNAVIQVLGQRKDLQMEVVF